MTSSDGTVGPPGCLAAAFWFAVQSFLLYPVVVLLSLPFLELMGSPIVVKGPMTGWAHREILLFSGFGLVIGVLAGVASRMGRHSTFSWAARRLWIPPVAWSGFVFVVGLLVWRKADLPVCLYFSPSNAGMDVFFMTLPTILYIAYSLGVDIAWRWQGFRRPDEV